MVKTTGICHCYYCNKAIDRSLEPQGLSWKAIGNRRYAHVLCDETVLQIKELCKKYMRNTYNEQKIIKKIKWSLQEGIDRDNLLYTVEYMFNVKYKTFEDIQKMNGGLAALDWVYEEAMRYKNKMDAAKSKNLNIQISDTTKTVRIKKPSARKPIGVEYYDLD